MQFVLVPSPLLGAATWTPVEKALVAAGHRAVVVPVDEVVPSGEDVVLVPHSNAGYWAPQLASTIGARATVFVDASLPPVDADETTLAPAQFLEFLEGLADAGGVLPPWTRWWDEDDLDGLFPDEGSRARVEIEQARLPLAYFRQRVPVPSGWVEKPCAYLAFGQTYAEELAFARRQKWPAIEIEGGHLHQLHDPIGVAAAIVELAQVAP